DRFQLKLHREVKDAPIYELVAAKGGPKVKPATAEGTPNNFIRGSVAGLHLEAARETMAQLALRLSGNGAGRPVMDKTGLAVYYAYTLDWVNGIPSPDSEFPTLFIALQEQLGLKLEPATGPVEFLIIDHAEKPAEN